MWVEFPGEIAPGHVASTHRTVRDRPMRCHIYKCLGLLLIVAVASRGEARAAVTVFDDFESYTAGDDLDGNSGGTGWTSAWTSHSANDVVSSEIDFGLNDGGSQAVKLPGAGGTGTTGSIYRGFTPQSDTFYASTLIKTVDVSAGFHQFGFSDDNDHDNSFSFIVRWDDLDARVNTGGGGTASAIFADGEEHLIVAKFTKGSITTGPEEFDRLDVYLDPKYSFEPTLPTVTATSSLIDASTFNTFFMRDTFGGETHFSNLTIGDSFGDVMTGAVTVESNFQQGVSPSVGYVADSTYIRQSWEDTPQDGDGDKENLVGFLTSSDEMRGLFEFDLSEIQAWSDEVAHVELVLTTRPNQAGSGSPTVAIHEYGFDFVEAAATWNDPAGDGSDSTVGGTLGTLLASATFNATDQGLAVTFEDTPEFRAAVAAALNSPDQTLRLLARQTSSGNSYVRFQNEEFDWSGDLSGRPLLIVHMAVPEPSSLLLACLGLAAVGLIRRRQRH